MVTLLHPITKLYTGDVCPGQAIFRAADGHDRTQRTPPTYPRTNGTPTMTPIAPPADDIEELTATWPLRTHLDLLAQSSSVPNARKFAGLILTEWALTGLADTTRLVVSELVTNALDHTTSAPVHLWLFSDGARVVVLVGDASQEPPIRTAEDTGAIGGRGLAIVHDVTGGHWGWFPRKAGKVVWALV